MPHALHILATLVGLWAGVIVGAALSWLGFRSYVERRRRSFSRRGRWSAN